MSELDDLKKGEVEGVCLITDREGRLRYVWCDDPPPEHGMRDEDAVEYVRRDKYDALAAHVERLFNKWDELTEEGTTHDELTDAMDEIFGSAATTSLANIKNEAAAEVLDQLHDLTPECSNCGWHWQAAELRRQAKGGNHEPI